MSTKKQAGISLVGLLLLLVLVGFGIYVAITLIPIYIDNWQISQSLKAVAHRADASTMDRLELQAALRREFQVGYVSHTDLSKDFTVESTATGGRLMVYDYTVRAPLIGNITLLVHFADQQSVPGS
ncbi:MAG: DUF4845 domain-containing protein [Gammaproteobacteria bacterium]|nr:DUF4845 domain-containing protein [Gammaproteobacteria bacterium]